MSSFSKITALPYTDGNIEVVPAKAKDNDTFYLTIAPIIKMFARGYGINEYPTVTPKENQYSGTSMSGSYDCPHSETYSGSSSVTRYTTVISSCAILRSSSSELKVNWYLSSGVHVNSKPAVYFTADPTKNQYVYSFDSYIKNSDSKIPNGTVSTYGPYAKVYIKPFLNISYFSWGNKYVLYTGSEHELRTLRRQYDGTTTKPDIKVSPYATGEAISSSGLKGAYVGTTGSAPKLNEWATPVDVAGFYDSLSISLSRTSYYKSSTGSDPNKYSLSGAKSYVHADILASSYNSFVSNISKHLSDNIIIDFVYNRTKDNYFNE